MQYLLQKKYTYQEFETRDTNILAIPSDPFPSWLGKNLSNYFRRSKCTHKLYNKNKTNRGFIRDNLSCKL